MIISLSSMSGDKTQLEEESLEALLQQLKAPAVISTQVGHHQDPKSSKFTFIPALIPALLQ